MVDFQERDTRRDLGDDGDEADDSRGDPDELDGRNDASDDGGGNSHHHDEHGHDDRQHGGHGEDGHHAHDVETVGAAVVTVSSSRTFEDDPSGDAIRSIVEEAGHEVVTNEIVTDDLDGVQSTVDALVDRGDVDLVVTTGGTGVTPDDVTVEAVRPLFDKELPGFGELFRRRSADEIGDRTIATRATAGVVHGVPVFCLPGSENAATLGADIIVPQAGHLAGLARRPENDG